MVLIKYTGLSFTLIGILVPFFSTVGMTNQNNCSVSEGNDFSVSALKIPAESVSTEYAKVQVFKLSAKKDVDFIVRLQKKSRRFNNTLSGQIKDFQVTINALSNYCSIPKIRKPDYYHFLYMFKPFEAYLVGV